MKVAQYKTNSINIADRFEPEAEQIESQQWRPESKPSDPTSTGTLDIPPELRYQEPTVSPIQPTIILDVNIGSPSCKIVPLSIFADSDPSQLVSSFASEHQISPSKSTKLLKIVETNMNLVVQAK